MVTLAPWRLKLHEIIFEADTPAGKAFDIALLISILLSVLAVMLESVPSIQAQYGDVLRSVEWLFTILFTVEYGLRLLSVGKPLKYATSFYGIVDLLAILPTYLSVIVVGTQSLIVIRALRLLRIFRILKLAQYVAEAQMLFVALKASFRKITVFLGTVLTLVLIIGAVMHLIEGSVNPGFNSIPESIYWTIVTLTTVGYGDVAPITTLGKALASVVMILGYGIIAVPTGIVSAELVGSFKAKVSTQACPECAAEGHHADAKHCNHCGAALYP